MTNVNPSLRASLITWYLAGCFLVFGMVVVGGITRLTGSGLSITEWKVVTGTLPPMNDAQWIEEFEKYQQIPQFKEINSHFTLSDFKFIYFWEYIHRLFGRLIGFVFLGGFIYFVYKGALKGKLLWQTAGMFLLGGIQGFLGWYMVSSGLTQNVYVSHLRLAIHLTFAFITFGYIFYIALTQLFPQKELQPEPQKSKLKPLATLLLFAVTLQIIYGAFVAGLKAGHIYTTWPGMNGSWAPESIGFSLEKDGISSLWNNPASVQFIHRNLAFIVTSLILFVAYKTINNKYSTKAVRDAASILLSMVVLQVTLGIITLLMSVPVWLGVMHQAAAFLLFASVIYYRYRLSEQLPVHTTA
jgi:cytochrome c oxidase assembly protein subunit 15